MYKSAGGRGCNPATWGETLSLEGLQEGLERGIAEQSAAGMDQGDPTLGIQQNERGRASGAKERGHPFWAP